MIENIVASPYFQVFAPIISILIAIILWRIPNRVKKPVYTVNTFNVIQDFQSRISNLSILYKDTPIKTLTISQLAFWNEGKETIEKSDISTANPLKIQSIDGVHILDKEIIYQTEPSNIFITSEIEDSKQFSFSFDFIDKNDAVVFKIIHDGKNSNDILLSGKIKGVKEIKRRKLQVVHRVRHIRLPGNFRINISDNILGYFLFLFFFLAFIFSLIAAFNNPSLWGVVLISIPLIIFFGKLAIISEIPENLGEFIQKQ